MTGFACSFNTAKSRACAGFHERADNTLANKCASTNWRRLHLAATTVLRYRRAAVLDQQRKLRRRRPTWPALSFRDAEPVALFVIHRPWHQRVLVTGAERDPMAVALPRSYVESKLVPRGRTWASDHTFCMLSAL